ncbi:MAG TPA: O-antigen ligase family protein [Anaerolineae bacterium]|nr:O-antigen ligase family protein [Anaerolineae bacterium]
MTSQRLFLEPRISLLPPVAPLIPVALLGVVLLVALLPPMTSGLLLAAAGLALAVLIRPWLGLPLTALIAPFAALRPLPLGGLPVDGADLALALTLAAWLAQGVAQRRIVLPRAPLTWPMLALLAALGLSLLAAPSYREGLPELLKWLQVLALYLAAAVLLTRRRAGWLIAALLAAGVGQALLGLHQFLTQTGPEAFILPGGFMRAYGAFRQPNPYAGYLGLAAPLAISLALWSWRGSLGKARRAHGLRLALTAAAGLISLGLLVSWSRGAWLAFGAALAVVLLAQARRAAPAMLALAVLAALTLGLLGAADLLPPAIAGRLGALQDYVGLVDVARTEVTDANFSVVERIAHWQAALDMWRDHLWLGVGAGNYAVVYEQYNLPRWYQSLGHAHNVYLNFAAEAGLLGLLAYGWFWLAALWQGLRCAAQRNRLASAVGAGVLGGLVAASVHNFFDNLWVQHIYLTLALLLGLLTSFCPAEPSAAQHTCTVGADAPSESMHVPITQP